MQAFTDLEAARRSRERARLHNTDAFYDEQARILTQWQWGEKPPEGLIFGELPEVNLKAIKLDIAPDLMV